MKTFTKLSLPSALFLLTACTSGGGDNEENITSTQSESYEILSFDVTGTSIDIANSIAPINAGINNGAFSIHWQLFDNATAYTAKLYFSSNNTLSNGDTSFYELHCQNSQLSCANNAVFNDDCTFDSQNIISCSEEPADAKDLTTVLPTLPFDGYIIFESCEFGNLTECDTPQAHAIRLE